MGLPGWRYSRRTAQGFPPLLAQVSDYIIYANVYLNRIHTFNIKSITVNNGDLAEGF